MHHLRHVFFDNDGTLIDSEILALRITLRRLAEHGIVVDLPDYARRFPGMMERDILATLTQEHGVVLPEDFQQQGRAEYLEVFQKELRTIPGMWSVFRDVRLPKSMVSNGSVRHVVRTLRRVRLMHALDGGIFSAEHVERPKPEPDVYLYALEQLQLRPADVLAIEDSPTGVLSAKAAGLRVVGFLGAAHIHDGHDQRLLECGADFLAANARALRVLLTQFDAL